MHTKMLDSVCKDLKTKLKGWQNQHYCEKHYFNSIEREALFVSFVCNIHFATHFCQRRPIFSFNLIEQVIAKVWGFFFFSCSTLTFKVLICAFKMVIFRGKWGTPVTDL